MRGRKGRKKSNLRVTNTKRMLLAFAWCALVVLGLFYVGRYFINDAQAKSKSENVGHYSELTDVALKPGMEVNVHDYKGFRVYFNNDYHIPNCVSYEIIRSETSGATPRYKNFEPDPNFRNTAYPSDYTRSGYDRGHMAPAGDMKWDNEAMHETFYMSNICPQNHSLNSGGWKKLEEKVRDWAYRDSSIIVVSGPILSNNMNRIGSTGVAVPERFFKVLLAPGVQKPRAIGFIYDNAPSKGETKNYAVSVDRVEAVTGYDFFHNLPDNIENRIESACNYNEWNR